MNSSFKKAWMYIRQVWAIYTKEVFQIVFSPMFLCVAGLSTFFWSFTYVRAFFGFAKMSASMPPGLGGGSNIHYSVFVPLIAQLNLLLIFIIPAITMKLFAEEKKQNTYDLLLSSPLTSTQIVLGKFFAAYKAVGILIFISSLYVIFTAFFADFHWTMPFLSYIGMLLFAGVYVAIDLFASTLTKSVVLSVVLGVIFNILLWYISQSSELVEGTFMGPIMEYLSVTSHFYNFAKGIFVTSSAVCFILVIIFFVFLSRQAIEVSRWR